jgi:hypothetical protein
MAATGWEAVTSLNSEVKKGTGSDLPPVPFLSPLMIMLLGV